MKLTGVIKSDGFVETFDGKLFILPIRGIDESGFPEVLIDATSVGGGGTVKRQSIKPFIGMGIEFTTNNGVYGYNFYINNMSEEIRQMIDKVKNSNQFINENYGNFDDVFNTIKTYIDFTLGSDKKINQYVPNTHIAEVFKEVLQACEKESMYPEIYHNLPHKDVTRISFLEKINEYFNLDLLEKNGEEEVHRVYQKLREKYDYIRQMLKLIDIRIPDEYNMTHKVKNDLKSDKIIIPKSFN